MFKVKKNQVIFDDQFDQFTASIPALRSTLYMVEGWSVRQPDEYDIVSFDDVVEFFRTWNQEEVDPSERYENVYDYLYDCIGQGFHPVKKIIPSIPDETIQYLCCECVIPYGDGNDLMVFTRYGQDDYGVWFTDTDHLTDESFGYSVRGSFVSIFDEMKGVM